LEEYVIVFIKGGYGVKSFFIIFLAAAIFSFGTVNETVNYNKTQTPKDNEHKNHQNMKTYKNGLLPLPDGRPVVLQPLPLPTDPPPLPEPMPNRKEKNKKTDQHH
jgi:hypothetical protein